MADTKTKKIAPLSICGIAQQLDSSYWDWTDEEKKTLAIARGGNLKPMFDVIISRLDASGMKVASAYAVLHNRDSQLVWDDVLKLEVVQQKVDHVHGVIAFDKDSEGKTLGGTIDEIAHAIGVASQYIEKAGRGRYAHDNMLAYLIHVKYEDKYQYEPSAVVTLRGKNYIDICKERMGTWLKGRGSVKRKAAVDGIDDLEERILSGMVTKSQVMLTDDLFAIYSRNRRRCDDAFSSYGERKVYRTLRSLENGDFMLTIFFVIGTAGSGKTNIFAKDLIKRIIADAATRGEKWSCCQTAATNPLDDYNGEEILLMDDVRGNCMLGEDWLKLLDPHNISAGSARYRNKVPASRVVIITSTKEPLEFFYFTKNGGGDRSEAMDQFFRRIQSLVRVVRTDRRDGMTIDEIKQSINLEIAESVRLPKTSFVRKPDNGGNSSDHLLAMDVGFSDAETMSYTDGLQLLAEKVASNNTLNRGDIDGKAEDNGQQ